MRGDLVTVSDCAPAKQSVGIVHHRRSIAGIRESRKAGDEHSLAGGVISVACLCVFRILTEQKSGSVCASDQDRRGEGWFFVVIDQAQVVRGGLSMAQLRYCDGRHTA